MFHKKSFKERRKQIEAEERVWNIERELLLRKSELEEEKAQFKKKRKRANTSKLLIAFLFISCTTIEIFTGYVTLKMLSVAMINGSSMDFSPLVTLIGAVVSEVIGYAVYSIKSTKENCVGGVVYETAMQKNNNAVG